MPAEQDETTLDPDPFLRKADDRFVKNPDCSICGTPIDMEGDSQTMLLVHDREPLCEDEAEQADEVVRVKSYHGYPWNGIHPETGETQAIGYGEYWVVEASLDLL